MSNVSVIDGHIDENKMTDIKKIIEDLEYARYHCTSNKGKDAINDALDLINRQQVEIEKLEYKLLGVMHFVDKWLDGAELEQDEVNRASAVREKTLQIVEKLKEENDFLKSIDIDKIKSEAIKEFAERLKNEYSHTLLPPIGYPIDKNDWIVYREDIEDLVEEMVGEDETT